MFDFGRVEGDAVVLLTLFPDCCRLDGVNYLKKGLGGGREVRGHSSFVVGLSVFCGCEELVECMEDGSAEVSEAFRRAEACECRAVDGAWVTDCFGRDVVCSDYGGDLLKEAGV